MTISLRDSRLNDGARCVEIWRDAVDATHDFLSTEDRIAIAAEVAGFLPDAPLTLAVDASDRPVGFSLVSEGRLEALFVDPACHGMGVGRLLVERALTGNPHLLVDVNEQNAAACAFYLHLGFEPIGRSSLDDQGRAYPLIHLQHRGETPAGQAANS